MHFYGTVASVAWRSNRGDYSVVANHLNCGTLFCTVQSEIRDVLRDIHGHGGIATDFIAVCATTQS